MALCQVQRSATAAFSPTTPYVALGTMAGAIDLSFSSSACLEVFRLDLSSKTTGSSATSGSAGRQSAHSSPVHAAADVSPDDFFGGLGSPDNRPGGLGQSKSSESASAGELPLVGSAPAGDRFNRLSWGLCGTDQPSLGLPLGIIAGGLVDGTVALWNPHKIIKYV